jgi:signal transduction histidine kinase
MRDIAITLRPPLLDFLGLCATLKSLGGKFANRSGLAVDVRCRHVPHLEGEIETMLYRIVEEALGHSVGHAGATRVDVLLVFAGGRLQLTVTDDGSGFDSPAEWEIESSALVTMRDRVEFAEGTLVLESMPGRGTTIRVDMPYATAARTPPRLLPTSGAGMRG